MSKTLTIRQNAIYNTLGAGFYLGCQWLITVLAVRLGSFESAGTLSLCMSWTNMFFTVASFGMRDYQVSDYTDKFSQGEYLSTRLFTCAIALVLCMSAVGISGSCTRYEAECILLYMLFRAGEAAADCFQAMEQRESRMDLTFISYLLRGLLMLGSFSAVLASTGDLRKSIAVMMMLTLMTVLLFDYSVCRRLIPLQIGCSPRTVGSMLLTGIPLVTNAFLMTAMVSIPRNTLEAVWGEKALGIYASIASPCVIVQTATSWLLAPLTVSFTRCYHEKRAAQFTGLFRRTGVLFVGITAVIFAGALLFGVRILQLLYGTDIAEYGGLLLPVLLTTVLIAVTGFLSALLTIARSLRALMISNILSAAVSALTSGFLVRRFGMNGVNFTVYAAMGLNIVLLSVSLYRALKKHFG